MRAKAEAYAEQTVDPFGAVVLRKEETFRFFRQLLNLDEAVSGSVRLQQDTSVDYQLCGTVLAWDEAFRHLRMGNRHLRVLSIKEGTLKHESGLPGRTVPNLLRDMLTVNCHMIVCEQWRVVERPEVRDEVRSRKKHVLDFERHGAFALEKEDEKADELMADESVKRLGSVLRQIENEGDSYGLFSYTVILHGTDNAKLDAFLLKTQEYSKVLRLRVPERQRWMFTTRLKEQRKRELAISEYGEQAFHVLAAIGGERG